MQELSFWDYVTLGVSALVLLIWAVLRVQRAINPNVGRGRQCGEAGPPSVNLLDIGTDRQAKSKNRAR